MVPSCLPPWVSRKVTLSYPGFGGLEDNSTHQNYQA